MIRGTLLLISMAFVWALAVPDSRSALGESDSTVETDRQSFSGRVYHQVSRDYAIHVINTDLGAVTEYATFGGTIFAVTWVGYNHPDLSVLLGSHFSEYKNEASRTEAPSGRGMRRTTTGNLVVELYGHMRKVQGRAYVPSLVPQGVDPEALP